MALVRVGIPFPVGTGSFWNHKTGELIVRQNVDNLSGIESFLEGLQAAESK
jgi:hypothetical protein